MTLLAQLHHKLIVSCQAEEGFPLNRPEHLAALAQTAVIGGASAIRASIPVNIRAIRAAVEVPIIGIYKKDYPGFEIRITPTITEVEETVAAGSDIIALDATQRPRPDGQSLENLYQTIRERFDIPLMADVSTLEEGIFAAELGFDIVAPTLSGYTTYSSQQPGPDLQLIRDLAQAVEVPIIAEGRISTPADVRAALAAGAYAVVVGSMITRPHLITERFVAATRSKPASGPVIAIDIGGTKIAGGVIDEDNQILLEDKISTPTAAGGPAILEQTINFIETLQQRFDGPSSQAIGVSTGGQIDAAGHIIGVTEMIPGWLGLPLKESVTAHFTRPTFVLNDGHAAALAEAQLGAGRGQTSMLCIVVGTGLGGGLVINGRLQHGANGLAGSVGQIKLSPDGQSYASLEAFVSGPALIRAYNEQVSKAEIVATGQKIAKRAQTGDEIARQTIIELGNRLGLGLSHALHMFDAACVVVGGSVAQLGPLFFDGARRSLGQHGHSTVANTPIVPAALGPKAGLLGAALFARQHLEQK